MRRRCKRTIRVGSYLRCKRTGFRKGHVPFNKGRSCQRTGRNILGYRTCRSYGASRGPTLRRATAVGGSQRPAWAIAGRIAG